MKTKQINPICTNCAHAKLIKDDGDDYGFQVYKCEKSNVAISLDKSTKEIGTHGIWSKECLNFKNKL